MTHCTEKHGYEFSLRTELKPSAKRVPFVDEYLIDMNDTAAAAVVTFFTFLPSFVFILAGGSAVETTHGKLGFIEPLSAITAAVAGLILNLALFFACRVG